MPGRAQDDPERFATAISLRMMPEQKAAWTAAAKAEGFQYMAVWLRHLADTRAREAGFDPERGKVITRRNRR